MSALDRKLLRDLREMQGQVITIALVVACGIASYATTRGTYESLVRARDGYYERHNFPDVFVHLERAPEALRDRVEAIPGVARAVTRVLEQASLPVEGLPEPAVGHVLSLPKQDGPTLGGVDLREGRWPEPGRIDEALVLEGFARAHGLRVGDRLPAVLGGVQRQLRIVGLALTPEYVFSVAPGDMSPDQRRFGVVWMERDAIAAAFQMDGAFNDLVVRLQPGASELAVVDQLNRVLEPYGGLGAYPRARQLSNNMLRGELSQLETLTTILPVIFLGVAAFLINVVLSRLVQLQRAQIATLKAVGYSRGEIGLHYLKLVSVIAIGGAALGIVFGVWLGGITTDLYTKYFHFPSLRYRLDARVLSTALGSSLLAAFTGALASVLAVMRLPPAEAMRPEAPASYKRSTVDRLHLASILGQSSRMVLREIERRPLRAFLSSLGVALAVAVLIAGRFGFDAVDWFMRVQFELSQRDDLSVGFRRAVPERALRELGHVPGVLRAEGVREVQVRFRRGHKSREGALFGERPNAELRRVVDREGRVIDPPEHGILVSRALAEILGARLGDEITLEVLEGKRGVTRVHVAALVDDVFGLFAHMRIEELDRVLDEEPHVSIALLSVDPAHRDEVYRALKLRPEVLGVNQRAALIEMFEKQTAGQMRITTLILTVFAVIIASGVIYNNARIALSTRSRDLASLRVLGFRKREISAVLIGELAIEVVLAIVPGAFLGNVLTHAMMEGADPEMYRFPVVISMRSYAFAMLVTFGAALLSALVVHGKLDRLDLIGVLKSRE